MRPPSADPRAAVANGSHLGATLRGNRSRLAAPHVRPIGEGWRAKAYLACPCSRHGTRDISAWGCRHSTRHGASASRGRVGAAHATTTNCTYDAPVTDVFDEGLGVQQRYAKPAMKKPLRRSKRQGNKSSAGAPIARQMHPRQRRKGFEGHR